MSVELQWRAEIAVLKIINYQKLLKFCYFTFQTLFLFQSCFQQSSHNFGTVHNNSAEFYKKLKCLQHLVKLPQVVYTVFTILRDVWTDNLKTYCTST